MARNASWYALAQALEGLNPAARKRLVPGAHQRTHLLRIALLHHGIGDEVDNRAAPLRVLMFVAYAPDRLGAPRLLGQQTRFRAVVQIYAPDSGPGQRRAGAIPGAGARAGAEKRRGPRGMRPVGAASQPSFRLARRASGASLQRVARATGRVPTDLPQRRAGALAGRGALPALSCRARTCSTPAVPDERCARRGCRHWQRESAPLQGALRLGGEGRVPGGLACRPLQAPASPRRCGTGRRGVCRRRGGDPGDAHCVAGRPRWAPRRTLTGPRVPGARRMSDVIADEAFRPDVAHRVEVLGASSPAATSGT